MLPDSKRFRVIECAWGRLRARYQPALRDVLLVDGFDYSGLPTSLSSQAFYDDCHQMLSPEGIMVVNLHSEHPQYAQLLVHPAQLRPAPQRQRDGEREGNVIVFASKGRLAQQRRHGVIGHPQAGESSLV